MPALWLFTDPVRLPDPRASVARLPCGAAGVVFRPGSGPAANAADIALGHDLARLCRRRRLAMTVAGNWRLAAALGVGVHVRGGRKPAGMKRALAVTGSAHGAAELVRARRLGVRLVFLSPVFPTASHPGAAALGAARWALLARRAGGAVAALGGVEGRNCRRLDLSVCRGAGAITPFVA